MDVSTAENDATLVTRNNFDCGKSRSDKAEDMLDECAQNLEELKMKILKTSVRCHMLEVDLATQFNPQNFKIFADAQESCQKCTQDVENFQCEDKIA